MEITDVKVIPVDDEKLKAFVSIVFDQSFVVTDIKIINGPKGLFVSMPSKKRKDGTFKDIAHPLNNQMRQYLEEKVLAVYRQQVASAPGASQRSAPGGGREAERPRTGSGRPDPGSGSGGDSADGDGGGGSEAPQS
jgi:stage V sporulation protein G